MFDEEEWDRLIDHARSELRPRQHMILAPADEFIELESRLLGVDVTNHVLRIDGSRIRHVMNRHGTGWVEGGLGQLPIRDVHIREIPEILRSPHSIERASGCKSHKPSLVFKRRYSDHGGYPGETIAHVIVSVRSLRNAKWLFFETMYWKRRE